jgi:hypothetical protein
MSLCGYQEERKRTISCVCCRGKISQRGTFEKQILLELLFVHYATVCDSCVCACVCTSHLPHRRCPFRPQPCILESCRTGAQRHTLGTS